MNDAFSPTLLTWSFESNLCPRCRAKKTPRWALCRTCLGKTSAAVYQALIAQPPGSPAYADAIVDVLGGDRRRAERRIAEQLQERTIAPIDPIDREIEAATAACDAAVKVAVERALARRAATERRAQLAAARREAEIKKLAESTKRKPRWWFKAPRAGSDAPL